MSKSFDKGTKKNWLMKNWHWKEVENQPNLKKPEPKKRSNFRTPYNTVREGRPE